LLIAGVSQIRSSEPGDTDWGVKLDDVRGQAEAKEEVRKIVTLWQSGGLFERSGVSASAASSYRRAGRRQDDAREGDRHRIQLAIVTIPGSGFASSFIGMDGIIVRIVARRARKLAAKWGGQCIVFIDEVDASGCVARRSGQPRQPAPSPRARLLLLRTETAR